MRLLQNSVWEIPRGLFHLAKLCLLPGNDLISTDLAIWDEMISLISFVPSDDSFFYPLSRFRCVLVFPHLEMSPPGSFRSFEVSASRSRFVAIFASRELISLWRDEVCGAAMPKHPCTSTTTFAPTNTMSCRRFTSVRTRRCSRKRRPSECNAFLSATSGAVSRLLGLHLSFDMVESGGRNFFLTSAW